MRYTGRLSWLMVLAIVPACGRGEPKAATSGKPLVFVSILPQACFVERVAGDSVQIEVMVPPGQSYHTYEPTPKQVAKLADAKLFFRIGTTFEDAVVKQAAAANPNLRVVDTREGVAMRKMTEEEFGEHAGHEHEGDHEHCNHTEDQPGAPDPHIWLAPKLAARQAQTICKALCDIDPARAENYRRNLAAFTADLEALDTELGKTLEPLKGRTFFVYHAAYGYFADAYGLRQVAVETGGKEPSAKQLAQLVRQAKQTGVRLIFVQPQLASASADSLAAEIGGAVVAMDPLSRDYLGNLRDMGAKIRQALGATSGPTTKP